MKLWDMLKALSVLCHLFQLYPVVLVKIRCLSKIKAKVDVQILPLPGEYFQCLLNSFLNNQVSCYNLKAKYISQTCHSQRKGLFWNVIDPGRWWWFTNNRTFWDLWPGPAGPVWYLLPRWPITLWPVRS